MKSRFIPKYDLKLGDPVLCVIASPRYYTEGKIYYFREYTMWESLGTTFDDAGNLNNGMSPEAFIPAEKYVHDVIFTEKLNDWIDS